MNLCPYCNAEIIDGDDVCDACGQPLDDLHLSDPASEIERALVHDRIGMLHPRAAVTVTSDETVHNVLRLLAEHRIGCVLVVDDGKLVGIFSERDAVIRIGPKVDDLRQHPISEFMTPNVQSLDPNAKVAFAVHMMDLGHYRHVPVVDHDGTIRGVFSVRDILRYLAERTAHTSA